MAFSLIVDEASHGIPLLFGIAITIIALLYSGSASPPEWATGWADRMTTVTVVAALAGPIGAGLALAYVALKRRSGLLDVAASTSRGRLAPLVLGSLAFIGWAGLAMVLALVVVSVRSPPAPPLTYAMLLVPLVAFTAVSAAIVIGVAVGYLTGAAVLAPVIAVVFFGGAQAAFYVRVLQGRDWLIWFEPLATDVFYGPLYEPSVRLLTPQLIALLSILLGTISIIMGRTLRALTLSILTIVGLSAAVVTATGPIPSPVEFRAAPQSPSCIDGRSVQFCMWPETTAVGQPVIDTLDQTWLAASRLLPERPPTAVRQPGLDGSNDGVVVEIVTRSDLAGSDILAAEAFLPVATCDDERVWAARALAAEVLKVAAGGVAIDDPELSAVLDGDEGSQRAWMADRVAQIRACNLSDNAESA